MRLTAGNAQPRVRVSIVHQMDIRLDLMSILCSTWASVPVGLVLTAYLFCGYGYMCFMSISSDVFELFQTRKPHRLIHIKE